ncbi:hypothetical protein ACIQVT_27445 [Streptomyces sp. NPDC100445]|uniref:hypothetical protein n=1 Tax=Streptomyces sp. NPDC100445 TaxID=3366102 RepID=UPI00380AED85
MTVPPDVRQHCRQARTSARADGLVPALTLLLRALSPKTPPRGPRGHAILPAELLAEFAAEDAALIGRSGPENPGDERAGDTPNTGHPPDTGSLRASHTAQDTGTPPGDDAHGAPGALSGAWAGGVAPVGGVRDVEVPPSTGDLGASHATQGTDTPTGDSVPDAPPGTDDLGAPRPTQATGTPPVYGTASVGDVTGAAAPARADAPGAGGVGSGGAVGLVPGLVLSRADGGRDGAGAEWAWAVAWLRLGMSERLRDACLAHLAARHAEGAPLLMRQLVKGTLAEVLLEHLEIEGVLDDVTAGRTGPLGPLRPADDRRLVALQEQITRADRALLRLLGAHGFTADGPGAGAHASELLADAYTPAAPGTGRGDA